MTQEKPYDALVLIGRFQPFHVGHQMVIKEAKKHTDQVIVVVGSCFQPRSIKNPYTFEERKQMIESANVHDQEKIKIVPSKDYPYNDNKWVNQIQSLVNGAIDWQPGPLNIALIGHNKDNSSYYLSIFPRWDNIDVLNMADVSGTQLRRLIFEVGEYSNFIRRSVPFDIRIIENIEQKEDFQTLRYDYQKIKEYKKSWESAPYPPTFNTVDSVVVQSGHVLLVRRGASPGFGQWALPGGFIGQDETLKEAMLRELKEETKIKVPKPVLNGSIKDKEVFDDPGRSERGRTITMAYYIDLGFDTELPKIKGSDDAEKAVWVPFKDVRSEDMFEDHWSIIDHFVGLG